MMRERASLKISASSLFSATSNRLPIRLKTFMHKWWLVRISDWKTGFGSRAFIAVLLNTFEPKPLSFSEVSADKLKLRAV